MIWLGVELVQHTFTWTLTGVPWLWPGSNGTQKKKKKKEPGSENNHKRLSPATLLRKLISASFFGSRPRSVSSAGGWNKDGAVN